MLKDQMRENDDDKAGARDEIEGLERAPPPPPPPPPPLAPLLRVPRPCRCDAAFPCSVPSPLPPEPVCPALPPLPLPPLTALWFPSP